MSRLKPLTIGLVREIRDRLGVDLLRAYEPAIADRLTRDYVFLGAAIAIAGGDPNLAGNALERAATEFLEKLREFFPKPSVFDDFIDEQEKTQTGSVDPWRVVFRAAGIAGVEPWGFSFREILWMAQGAYEPHAVLIAMQINSAKKQGQRATDPDTVNPWHPKRPRPKKFRNKKKAGTDARTDAGK